MALKGDRGSFDFHAKRTLLREHVYISIYVKIMTIASKAVRTVQPTLCEQYHVHVGTGYLSRRALSLA